MRIYFVLIIQMLFTQTIAFFVTFLKTTYPDSVGVLRLYDIVYTYLLLISNNLFYIGISKVINRTTNSSTDSTKDGKEIIVLTRGGL